MCRRCFSKNGSLKSGTRDDHLILLLLLQDILKEKKERKEEKKTAAHGFISHGSLCTESATQYRPLSRAQEDEKRKRQDYVSAIFLSLQSHYFTNVSNIDNRKMDASGIAIYFSSIFSKKKRVTRGGRYTMYKLSSLPFIKTVYITSFYFTLQRTAVL